jgi:flagellar motor switch/type III secretory pathway protein FliN
MENKPSPSPSPQTEPRSQPRASAEGQWASLASLPCTVSVELVAPHVTVGNLLDLGPGSVINSLHSTTDSVPISINGVELGSGEFDIVGKHVAVRVTEVY